jgi:ATP-dependent Clp protease ATP-binding subunit ClpC
MSVVTLLVGQMNKTLERKRLTVTVTDEAKKWILEKTCSDRSYGARPLRRALQRYVEDPLSEALIQGKFNEGSNIEIYLDNSEIQYRLVDVEQIDPLLTH